LQHLLSQESAKSENRFLIFLIFFLPQLERNEPKNERSASKKSHCQDFGAHHIHFFLQFKLISSGKNSFLCFVKSLLRILSFYRDSLSIPRIGNEQHEAKIQISIKRIATIRQKHH
jgi:hypothetical protein